MTPGTKRALIVGVATLALGGAMTQVGYAGPVHTAGVECTASNGDRIEVYPPAHNGDGTATGVGIRHGNGAQEEMTYLMRDVPWGFDEEVARAPGRNDGHKMLPAFRTTPGKYYTTIIYDNDTYCESQHVDL
ncbi:hypothetical protein ACH4RA_10330 [Streptomyces smyrnaeus]|uniref:hypothetical protein n=1 Tax=Streptomyces TaxID=1883 RepID=UPI000C18FE25|nr:MULTISPECIES: hypothetical protein [unclassified Streptomyces]MBQ0864424.1 hypothetical protein [Streptomyces sp. RK75]MBQ1118764.1 hypothetical protein [Streptomyces sp. B15]